MADAPHQTDVAIIGAGPVGLFAVFECGMLGLQCHLIDSLEALGGQCVALYPEKPIYDIPGAPVVMAGELVARLAEQAAPFKPVYHLGQQVVSLTPTETGWRLETSAGAGAGAGAGIVIEARAVILAAGAGAFGPNRPPLAGIEDYEGRSVFYLVSRREDFRDRRVVIAGGGDSALDWVLSLAEVARKIYVVHRRPKFRGAPETVARMRELAEASERVEIVVPYVLHALEGRDGMLEAVVVATLKGETRRLEADVLLPFFGLSMNLGPIADWGLALDRHCVVVDPASSATSRAGVFAIGDIASYPGKLKLILSGFSEAAMAAHAIYKLVHPERELHWEYSTTKGVPGIS
ncbi:MAG: NAD(P)/FAD-dependent oxidoreductase [Proteobacteria bacterium]|nr:NAD(P)/FAD-dependent oxidoreductase [Pseudomonadota bacterium]